MSDMLVKMSLFPSWNLFSVSEHGQAVDQSKQTLLNLEEKMCKMSAAVVSDMKTETPQYTLDL